MSNSIMKKYNPNNYLKLQYNNNLPMFFLAIYPILRIYLFLPGISCGDMVFLWLICHKLFVNNGKISLSYPTYYILCWVYMALSYLLISYFKPTAFIPGGWSFFMYSIIFGFVVSRFDYIAFKKYYRIIFVISFIIFIFQEIMFFYLGYRFHALLPFGKLLDGYSMKDMISDQMIEPRSSSFFREPAHFAQFVLPLLVMELFDSDGLGKFLNKYAFIIILLLLFLKSGNGIIGLIFVLGVKSLHYLYYKRMRFKIIKIIIASIFLAIPIVYYMKTESAKLMVFRSSELQNDEDSGSYIRIYRGYALYKELPIYNKLFGISEDDLVRMIPKTSISYLFTGERTNDVYCNCIQTILIYSGFLGLLFMILVYYHLFKFTRVMGRTSILLLIVISLIASIYNSYLMLFCTCLAEYNKKLKK